MDPLTITAGVIALASQCVKSAKRAADCFKSYRRARQTIEGIRDDAAAVEHSLGDIRDHLARHPSDTSFACRGCSDRFDALSRGLTATLSAMDEKFAGLQRAAAWTHNVRVLWDESEWDQLVSDLQRKQSGLVLFGQTLLIHSLSEVREALDRRNRHEDRLDEPEVAIDEIFPFATEIATDGDSTVGLYCRPCESVLSATEFDFDSLLQPSGPYVRAACGSSKGKERAHKAEGPKDSRCRSSKRRESSSHNSPASPPDSVPSSEIRPEDSVSNIPSSRPRRRRWRTERRTRTPARIEEVDEGEGNDRDRNGNRNGSDNDMPKVDTMPTSSSSSSSSSSTPSLDAGYVPPLPLRPIGDPNDRGISSQNEATPNPFHTEPRLYDTQVEDESPPHPFAYFKGTNSSIHDRFQPLSTKSVSAKDIVELMDFLTARDTARKIRDREMLEAIIKATAAAEGLKVTGKELKVPGYQAILGNEDSRQMDIEGRGGSRAERPASRLADLGDYDPSMPVKSSRQSRTTEPNYKDILINAPILRESSKLAGKRYEEMTKSKSIEMGQNYEQQEDDAHMCRATQHTRDLTETALCSLNADLRRTSLRGIKKENQETSCKRRSSRTKRAKSPASGPVDSLILAKERMREKSEVTQLATKALPRISRRRATGRSDPPSEEPAFPRANAESLDPFPRRVRSYIHQDLANDAASSRQRLGDLHIVEDQDKNGESKAELAFHQHAPTLNDIPQIVARDQAKEQRPNTYRRARKSSTAAHCNNSQPADDAYAISHRLLSLDSKLGKPKSQTSLLIEYFEGGRTRNSRPSVRVKVTPSKPSGTKTRSVNTRSQDSKDDNIVPLEGHQPITERSQDDCQDAT